MGMSKRHLPEFLEGEGKNGQKIYLIGMKTKLWQFGGKAPSNWR